MAFIPGFESDNDAQCRDPACAWEPKVHGKSHLPTSFVLIVNGPGYGAQFRVGATYLDEAALKAVFADLYAHVWRDWCRLTNKTS